MKQATTESARPANAPGDLLVARFTYVKQPVRLVVFDNEPWFVVADACDILRLNRGQVWLTVDSDDQKMILRSHLRAGKTALVVRDDMVHFVSEAGLYELITRAHNPDTAKAFRRWITHGVIPTIVRSNIATSHSDDIPFVVKKVKVSRSREHLRDVPHALYRFYDTDGALLYVGISWRPAMRMMQHQKGKQWWSQVGDVKFEHYPDLASADAAETLAIRAEHPRYNLAKVS